MLLLQVLREEGDKCSSCIRDLHLSFRGKTLPRDTNEKLSSVELMTEKCLSVLTDKETEHKRSRNVRYQFQEDVDEIQRWVSESETKIQDRTLEPPHLKTNINEVQSYLTSIQQQLDTLVSNGVIIMECTKSQQEKELIQSTSNNMKDQLRLLQKMLQEKKNAVNDALDAWQRFLQIYSVIKTWHQEKESFVSEPLEFQTLSVAKTKLQEYSTNMKSVKNIIKNLSEMEKELKKVSSVCNSGDLPDKLAEVERLKSELESQMLDNNATLLEMTEEWEQCEKKLLETKSWINKAKDSLESGDNRRRPIRDQLNLREKMLSDMTIQKKRADLALKKLSVHVTGSEMDVQVLGQEIAENLSSLSSDIKEQCKTLELCLSQLEKYQQVLKTLNIVTRILQIVVRILLSFASRFCRVKLSCGV